MSEVTLPDGHPYREGHIPNMQVVFLDLYRLLSIFLASKNLAALRDEHGLDPISSLQEPELDEVTRILLSSAITARIVDDREKLVLSERNTECGSLVEDLTKPDVVVALGLREACNKIIHARKIRTDLEQENYKYYLNPTLYFYGERDGKEWKASVDIVEYVKQYYINLNFA